MDVSKIYTKEGLFKNIQDGIFKPLGSQEIKKKQKWKQFWWTPCIFVLSDLAKHEYRIYKSQTFDDHSPHTKVNFQQFLWHIYYLCKYMRSKRFC